MTAVPNHISSVDQLFESDAAEAARPWTCVRTRPRWEKKLTTMLAGRGERLFLPTYEKTTVSHRKRRVSQIPLFPGYVFIVGSKFREDLGNNPAVVGLIRPVNERQQQDLHRDLRNVWLYLHGRGRMAEAETLEPGDTLKITTGEFHGTEGSFARHSGGQRLILRIELLGVEAEVNVHQSQVDRISE